MKTKLKEKLSSRKFWCAVGAVVIAVAGVFGFEEATAAQAIMIASAVGALIAYILGESYVDGKKYETGIVIKANSEVAE